jgi:hypothetical protein
MTHNWVMLIYKGRKSGSKNLILLKWVFTTAIGDYRVCCLFHDSAKVEKDSVNWVMSGHGAAEKYIAEAPNKF